MHLIELPKASDPLVRCAKQIKQNQRTGSHRTVEVTAPHGRTPIERDDIIAFINNDKEDDEH